jgi:hypothetical protein
LSLYFTMYSILSHRHTITSIIPESIMMEIIIAFVGIVIKFVSVNMSSVGITAKRYVFTVDIINLYQKRIM